MQVRWQFNEGCAGVGEPRWHYLTIDDAEVSACTTDDVLQTFIAGRVWADIERTCALKVEVTHH